MGGAGGCVVSQPADGQGLRRHRSVPRCVHQHRDGVDQLCVGDIRWFSLDNVPSRIIGDPPVYQAFIAGIGEPPPAGAEMSRITDCVEAAICYYNP